MRRASRAYLDGAGPNLREDRFSVALDRYVRGDSTSDDLLAAASIWAERLVAHYLVGLERLADGDRPGAMHQLRKSTEYGHFALSTVFPLYDAKWAHLLLDRLEKDPNWPPWIPAERPAGKS